jgi:hypothetical protein
VVESSTLAEVEDSFSHVAVILVVTSQLETSLRIVSAESELGCVLYVADVAQKPDTTSEILGFAIEFESLLNVVLSF